MAEKEKIRHIQVLSDLISRINLANKLGLQYNGDRNIYTALGYSERVNYTDFINRYIRQDIATAIIDKPVDASWQGGCLIQESTKKDTELEIKWKNLIRRDDLNVITKLCRLDKLVGLGSYAILLFGLSDVPNKQAFITPVSNNVSLLYLQPLGENHATVKQWEENPNNPRYGLPKIYELELNYYGSSSNIINVHHSRVLHIAGNLLEGDVKGISRLLPIYNRLCDLEKLIGSSAEMFWRGARPGYKGKLDEGYVLNEDGEQEIEDQLDEYEHNLRRFLITRGVNLDTMEMQVADPINHVDVQLQMISAYTGIPKRILIGSERGELASTQDMESWYTLIKNRRTNYIEKTILRPFIKKCQEFGILPLAEDQQKGYSIKWEPLFEKSDKDKAKVGEIRSKALSYYASHPEAQKIIPTNVFYKYFLGLDDDQVDMVTSIVKENED